MSMVGIKELKNRLTHYIRRTKQGEEIVVTERGKPVAVLTPIGAERQVETVEAKLARLAARGIVTLPTRKPMKRVRRVGVSGKPVSQTVVEDRR
jgi:prevent-host-death family protein